MGNTCAAGVTEVKLNDVPIAFKKVGVLTPGDESFRRTKQPFMSFGDFFGKKFMRKIAVFFSKTGKEPSNRSVWERLGSPKTGLGL
jgi:hypothetical protein